MRLYLFIALLISYSSFSQNFNTLYNEAKEDYYNDNLNSKSFDKALNACENVTKHPELLLFKGISLDFNGKKLMASKYLNLALKHLKDKKYLYDCYSYLGYIYTSANDLNNSLQYYNKALVLAKEIADVELIIETEFNLLLRKHDLSTNKKQSLQKIVDFYNNLPTNITDDVKFSYLTIVVDLSEGNLLLNEYLKLKNSLKNLDINALKKTFQGQFYNSMAILESYIKNYERALVYADSSYAISKKYNFKETILNDLYTYKTIYRMQDNLDKVVKYTDTIQSLEQDLKEQELQSGIEIIDENILYNTVIKKAAKKESILYSLTGALGIGLLVILFLLFISIKIRKKLQNSKDNYKRKYNSLWSDYQISIQQLTKLKESLNKQVKNTKSKDLNILLNEIKLHLNSSTKEEHRHINLLKNKFITSLEKKAPYLNSQEQIVCFFIALKVPHKKIGEILNKTEKSIDSYKYRINTKVKNNNNQTIDNLCKELKNDEIFYK